MFRTGRNREFGSTTMGTLPTVPCVGNDNTAPPGKGTLSDIRPDRRLTSDQQQFGWAVRLSPKRIQIHAKDPTAQDSFFSGVAAADRTSVQHNSGI